MFNFWWSFGVLTIKDIILTYLKFLLYCFVDNCLSSFLVHVSVVNFQCCLSHWYGQFFLSITYPSDIGDLNQFWLVILLSPFGFIAPKNLNYLAFKSFDFEHTWWSLFQKRVMRTKFDIYIFIITLTRINIYVQNVLVIVESAGTVVRDIQIFDS